MRSCVSVQGGRVNDVAASAVYLTDGACARLWDFCVTDCGGQAIQISGTGGNLVLDGGSVVGARMGIVCKDGANVTARNFALLDIDQTGMVVTGEGSSMVVHWGLVSGCGGNGILCQRGVVTLTNAEISDCKKCIIHGDGRGTRVDAVGVTLAMSHQGWGITLKRSAVGCLRDCLVRDCEKGPFDMINPADLLKAGVMVLCSPSPDEDGIPAADSG